MSCAKKIGIFNLAEPKRDNELKGTNSHEKVPCKLMLSKLLIGNSIVKCCF